MQFDIHILGSSSALPGHGRHPSAQVIHLDNKYYLVDCGEGTQIQFERHALKKNKIDTLFVSHIHGDHIFGILPLLTSYTLYQRQKELCIVGPEKLKTYIEESLQILEIPLSFNLKFITLKESDNIQKDIYRDEKLSVHAISLNHRAPTFGYIFEENQKARKILIDETTAYGISTKQLSEIKKGKDGISKEGKIIPNRLLTREPPATRKYVYMTDTRVMMSHAENIESADLLYHEATFMDDQKARAEMTHHSTAREAAEFAKKSKVQKLLLGHFSTRYSNLAPLLAEAKSIFPSCELATEGEIFSIPQKPVNERNE